VTKRYIFPKKYKDGVLEKLKIKCEPRNARMLFICLFKNKTRWLPNVEKASIKILRNFIGIKD